MTNEADSDLKPNEDPLSPQQRETAKQMLSLTAQSLMDRIKISPRDKAVREVANSDAPPRRKKAKRDRRAVFNPEESRIEIGNHQDCVKVSMPLKRTAKAFTALPVALHTRNYATTMNTEEDERLPSSNVDVLLDSFSLRVDAASGGLLKTQKIKTSELRRSQRYNNF